MKIGELTYKCGVAASAIRFYESKGLLKSIPRKLNGYRKYPEDAVVLLTIIVSSQQAGFSLDGIKQILPLNKSNWEHDKLLSTLTKKFQILRTLKRSLKKVNQNSKKS